MTISKEKIIKLAGENGIELKESALKFNESGLDFLVVFGEDSKGENWVLRIPRREDVLPSTKIEKQALDFIEPKLSVQAPKWVVWTDELIAYKQLTGVPVGTIDHEAMAYTWEIDEKNVPELFTETLALAMVSLHGINLDDAREAGLKVENAEEMRAEMKSRMEKVKAEFGVSDQLWEQWQRWVNNDSLWPAKTGVIHGDLHAGHILIDDEARVTGFIDWTEAFVSDISKDFVAHYRTFGEQELKKLIMYYEKAGGCVWPNMAEHIIERTAAYPVEIAEFALKSGIEEYIQMTKEALGVPQNNRSKKQ
ncbi:macrolide 2'-phosphotransferase [Jeotgalibacillus proteolyticus]|uniref:Macrolide 2'-phosphotransferase n=1 Tax=Jeotgalibacillus proteolyticus TaxID=2082395 RepID=A0A2S5GCW5_9BACL|nr:macrolide 2'-phosphotransferase [Jeotgalibacillus proteolyticus]PPA70850.1 macrolide 2'-phosphotransferase [Jeotgalibacillus proteolyticus]